MAPKTFQEPKELIFTEQENAIISFIGHMECEGLKEATIANKVTILHRLIKMGANILEPKTVTSVLLHFTKAASYKLNIASIYKTFCDNRKIFWKPPKITVTVKQPFLPTHEEVLSLISGSGILNAILIQILYETGMRIGEASQLKWTDVDFQRKTISVNKPEKNSNSRTLKISDTLIGMLNRISHRKDGNILNPNKDTLYSTFRKTRLKVAKVTQNTRLVEIHPHTFRHLKGTTEYQKTKDILHVAYILGHKHVKTTQRYITYISYEPERYVSKIAKTEEEFLEFLDKGFECVTNYGFNQYKVLRKRK